MKGHLKIIADCADALTTLDRYDHGKLGIDGRVATTDFVLDYDDAIQVVASMTGEFDGLFGLEKVTNPLCFVVKNHAFPDGNKRIADNALVALTLLIAESRPAEKETIMKVVINLINRNIE